MSWTPAAIALFVVASNLHSEDHRSLLIDLLAACATGLAGAAIASGDAIPPIPRRAHAWIAVVGALLEWGCVLFMAPVRQPRFIVDLISPCDMELVLSWRTTFLVGMHLGLASAVAAAALEMAAIADSNEDERFGPRQAVIVVVLVFALIGVGTL